VLHAGRDDPPEELLDRLRPRAGGDVPVLRLAAEEHGEEIVGVAARQVAKQPTLPAQIDRAMIDAIPEAPGVYIFYGEGALPLYVGKSVAMRSRVLAHFCDDVRSARAMRLAREVRRIDWQRTAGELGALLREAQLVKELAPAYNRQLRKANALCGFVFDGKRLRLADEAEIDADTLPFVYGVFRSRRAALAALHDLADAHGLCLQALGYDIPRSGACFRHQIGRCAGVCAGKESIHRHHARLATELARLKARPWHHRGALGIVEHDESRDATEVHVVDRWCYLGTARADVDVHELAAARAHAVFDPALYRILARFMKSSARSWDILPLRVADSFPRS
jgi:DNA polymerase-3 subunit epsilon